VIGHGVGGVANGVDGRNNSAQRVSGLEAFITVVCPVAAMITGAASAGVLRFGRVRPKAGFAPA